MASLRREAGKPSKRQATKSQAKNGRVSRKGWRLQFYIDKRRQSVWLGDISKKRAEDTKRFIEDLIAAKAVGHKPDGDAAAWAESLEGRLRDALVNCGLCRPATPKPSLDVQLYLGPFIDHYLKLRTDLKPCTITKFEQMRSWAVEFFGDRKQLDSITPADFEQWLRWMREKRVAADGKTEIKPLSPATANKHGKRLRQLLEFALKSRFIKTNPSAEYKLGSEVNTSRQAYVTAKMAIDVLEQCPDVSWKLIFALPRYAGFRCPTEVLNIRWSDVDWERGRMRVDSVKTGLRFCPIFPELRPILEEAWNEAAARSQTKQPARDSFVVSRYRDSAANLRTHMLRLIKAAGLEAWPKVFVNLRSSCRTDLEERFPSHVVNSWLGHSTRVAEKHYLQVTDDHWQRANGGAIGGDIFSNGGAIGGDSSTPLETVGVGADNDFPVKSNGQQSGTDSRELAECPRKDSNLGPAD